MSNSNIHNNELVSPILWEHKAQITKASQFLVFEDCNPGNSNRFKCSMREGISFMFPIIKHKKKT